MKSLIRNEPETRVFIQIGLIITISARHIGLDILNFGFQNFDYKFVTSVTKNPLGQTFI